MFKDTLKELRLSKKWTQDELGQKLHVSDRTIGTWERGTRQPNLETINEIASLFNVTTDYLLGRPEKQTESRQQTISEAIDTAMANDGKELDQHDKDVIKSIIEAYLDNKK